jgi:nicotinic acid phosphoribosyltransferase
MSKFINSLADVAKFEVGKDRFLSATHDEIRFGATTDIYFVNTRDVLSSVGRLDVPVTVEVFARAPGVFAGFGEVMELLKYANMHYNQTLLLITHDDRIALQADRVLTVEDGHIVRDEVRS